MPTTMTTTAKAKAPGHAVNSTPETVRIALCVLDDLPLGLGRSFRVDGREIALFRNRSGSVFGVDGRCPHRNGPLADGMLAGDQIVCPLHSYRFDSRTGECDTDGVCSIRTYPVEVSNGTVLVTVTR
ncbi:MAG: nitrite reductase (NAD(P)H) small subunit [Gemmataceae bacterium]